MNFGGGGEGVWHVSKYVIIQFQSDGRRERDLSPAQPPGSLNKNLPRTSFLCTNNIRAKLHERSRQGIFLMLVIRQDSASTDALSLSLKTAERKVKSRES